MTITSTSLLSCLISSALLTVLAWLIIKNDSTLKVSGKHIGIFLTFIVMRILLPVEFGFTITFFSRNILTGLRDFMFSGIKLGEYEISVGRALLFLWIAGAVCRCSIYAREYIHFIHMIGKCPGYFKHDMKSIIGKINHEYGKAGKFKILLAPGIETPAIFGFVHPKILMPMVDYTEGEIYYILKHEMLHYYHHDMMVNILCEVLCTVYWWNPAVFLLKKIITRVLEIRVDCLVTSGFNEKEKINYLECIVKSMKAGGQENTRLMITFAAQTGSSMMQRFHCIWANHWLKNWRKGVLVAAVSCLLFLASVSFIVEPWYDPNVPGTFGYPEIETSYIVERDGYYEVYIDGELLGKIIEITEPFTELKIYKED